MESWWQSALLRSSELPNPAWRQFDAPNKGARIAASLELLSLIEFAACPPPSLSCSDKAAVDEEESVAIAEQRESATLRGLAGAVGEAEVCRAARHAVLLTAFSV